MSSVFYCTELSVSCWYCNANHGNLHQVIFEASEAHLYNFGEYEEDIDITECEDTDTNIDHMRGNDKDLILSTSSLPLLFPLMSTDKFVDEGISKHVATRPIRKNVKLQVVFNLM